MVILETERLLLRTLEAGDIDSAMQFWGNEDVMKYCGGAGDRERESRAIQFYINLQKEKGFSPYAVILKKNNRVIGVCGFNPPTNDYDMELMYHLAKEYWGKGYATEAAKACIDYAWKQLNANKIFASIDPRNEDSKKVLEKLGFKYIGMQWFEATKQEEPCFELTRL